jgi:oligoendopeptidase F
MFTSFPSSADETLDWRWDQFKGYAQELLERPLSAGTVEAWLADWSRWIRLVVETRYRLEIGTLVDTADERAKQRYDAFLDDVLPGFEEAHQQLKERLLASGLEVENFTVQLKKMRGEAEIFRQENLPLISEERKLSNEYFEITGAQTVEWEGQEVPIQRLFPYFEDQDRALRERAWRMVFGRRLEDRERLNAVWEKLMSVRGQLAKNAGLPDYRAYRWKQLGRLDYTPEDARRFQASVEAVVVPVLARLHEKRRARLGVENLRPWDLMVDPDQRPPLRPFEQVEQLTATVSHIFNQLDPQLGEQFGRLRPGVHLDLESRKGKAPGGVQYPLPLVKQPFIFMNAVGMHADVSTLIHEAGHAFHTYAMEDLPYFHQTEIGMEIAEVASMSMELLAAPYLTKDRGGFYTRAEAAQAQLQELETIIKGWADIAMVDALQHWIYENHAEASQASAVEEKFAELRDRFEPGVDWQGLEREKRFWQRILHIYEVPFYYLEYGLAQLAAIQIWGNAMRDPQLALQKYRQALALGETRPLPELYAAAGAKLAFDEDTLGEAVRRVEGKIEELEGQLSR